LNDSLIIDVGMHTGEDTAFYLAKGFDVVAIEANPVVIEAARDRFSEEIATGRLRVLEAAIAPQSGKVPLAVAEDMTIWSSLSPDFVRRNQALGTKYEYVEVKAIRFEDVLQEYGIPYYLKVDIEGLDMLCVKALHTFTDRPRFVSIESTVSVNTAPFVGVFDELAHLWVLGYSGFKYVDQKRNPLIRCPDPPAEGRFVDVTFTEEGSGPFGEETPGEWEAIDAAMTRAQRIRLHQNFAGVGGRWARSVPAIAYRAVRQRLLQRPIGWYDLHAKLAREDAAV